jgi:hypothetical protein
LGAFANQITLEFGQRREQIKAEPALRCGGIDRVVEALKPDTAFSQRIDQLDQVFKRPTQAIEFSCTPAQAA